VKPPEELRGQEAVATPEKRSHQHLADRADEVTRDLPVEPVPSDSQLNEVRAPSAPFEPQAGLLVDGRYRLEAQLGEGGMGVVFSARNERTGNEVALKFLRVHQCSAPQRRTRVARFVREGQAAGRINHPNVVDVYDVGGDADFPYLVMERLHGETLWQRMSRGDLTIDAVLDILIPVMRGVAAAHAHGVIHRDLKPDNIFLARGANGEGMTPKVLDFGVSRLVESSDVERSTTLTRQGLLIGTPSYMPLEQLRGDRNVDARADVYALGVVLYEALIGQRPFEASNDHELAIKMATTDPSPLARALPAAFRGLDPVVLKALAREPKDRYADANAFADALEAFRKNTVASAAAYDAELAAKAPRPSRGRSRSTLIWAVALTSVAVALWALLAMRTPPRAGVPSMAASPLDAAQPVQGPELVEPMVRPPESPSGQGVTTPGDASALTVQTPQAAHPGAKKATPGREGPRSAKSKSTSKAEPPDRATTLLPTDF